MRNFGAFQRTAVATNTAKRVEMLVANQHQMPTKGCRTRQTPALVCWRLPVLRQGQPSVLAGTSPGLSTTPRFMTASMPYNVSAVTPLPLSAVMYDREPR
jgi:hypothetical protein